MGSWHRGSAHASHLSCLREVVGSNPTVSIFVISSHFVPSGSSVRRVSLSVQWAFHQDTLKLTGIYYYACITFLGKFTWLVNNTLGFPWDDANIDETAQFSK